MFNLTDADYKELEDFLISEESPEECMDISMLDGFLTAVLIGPETIQPYSWLPVVIRAKSEAEFNLIPKKKLERIVNLIITHYNIIAHTFLTNPDEFHPMFYHHKQDGKTYEIIDEWCMGFMIATAIYGDSWLPLIKHKKHSSLLLALSLYGTPGGWEDLENDPETKKVPHEDWVKHVRISVPEIYRFWLPYREAKRTESNSDHPPIPRVDQNAPCPCGSGKKFKNCCWGKVH